MHPFMPGQIFSSISFETTKVTNITFFFVHPFMSVQIVFHFGLKATNITDKILFFYCMQSQYVGGQVFCLFQSCAAYSANIFPFRIMSIIMSFKIGELRGIVITYMTFVRLVIINVMFIFHMIKYFFLLFCVIVTRFTLKYLPDLDRMIFLMMRE